MWKKKYIYEKIFYIKGDITYPIGNYYVFVILFYALNFFVVLFDFSYVLRINTASFLCWRRCRKPVRRFVLSTFQNQYWCENERSSRFLWCQYLASRGNTFMANLCILLVRICRPARYNVVNVDQTLRL